MGGSITATQDSALIGKDDPARKLDEDKKNFSASGVSVYATNNSKTDGTIEGSVEAVSEKYAYGMSISADEGSQVDVTVGDGIYAEGGVFARGLYVGTNEEKSTATVTVEGGGIEADGGKNAEAIRTYANGGSVDVSVVGDVVSSGDGIVVTNGRNTKWEEADITLPVIESEFYYIYGTTDENGKDITVKQYRHIDGDTEYIYDSLGNVWKVTLTDEGKRKKTPPRSRSWAM